MTTPRKTRIDKGNKRKPAPTERETWRNQFRALPAADQQFELGYLTAVMEAGQKPAIVKTEPASETAALPLEPK